MRDNIKAIGVGVVVVVAAVFLVWVIAHSDTGRGVTNIEDSQRVVVYADTERNVTCWSNLRGGGIDCIPNSQLDPIE